MTCPWAPSCGVARVEFKTRLVVFLLGKESTVLDMASAWSPQSQRAPSFSRLLVSLSDIQEIFPRTLIPENWESRGLAPWRASLPLYLEVVLEVDSSLSGLVNNSCPSAVLRSLTSLAKGQGQDSSYPAPQDLLWGGR